MAREVRQVDAGKVADLLREVSAEVLPEGIELCYLPIDDLREQDVNPRSMTPKMFEQLVHNIRDAGVLESVPLAVESEGVYHIISGHHRIRAARAAGLTHSLVLVYHDLPRSRVKSKQLAHNTISGKDDPELLRRVWEQINDVRARLEAFVDPRVFDAVPDPVRFRQVDVDLASLAKHVLVLFLPVQKADFDAAIEAILPNVDLDTVYLAHRDAFEGWKAALRRVRQDLNIASVPTAIAEMARLAVEALDRRAADAGEDGEQEG